MLPPDPATREAFAAFLGREAHPSGAGQAVMHIKAPQFPQYRFEWHPQARKVLMIRTGSPGPLRAEVIAEHAETHGAAYGFVQTWLRGFREGQAPGPKPHLEG